MKKFLLEFRSKKEITMGHCMRVIFKAGMVPSILYKSHRMINMERIVFQMVGNGSQCHIAIQMNHYMGGEKRISHKENLEGTEQSTEHNSDYFVEVFKLSSCP